MTVGMASQMFQFAASGSNWTLSPTSNTSMCVDAGAATNGTALALASCNGGASQKFTISADPQSGNFFFKASNTGRCVQPRSSSTSAGTVMETDDCTSGSAQKFAVQAVATPNGTGGTSGTGGTTSTGGTTGTGGSTGGSTGTGGSSPFDPNTVYRMVPQQATSESVDVANGVQTAGTAVQQYATTGGNANQGFYIRANGSNWSISMKANSAKCLGLSGNGSNTGNGTAVQIQDCNTGNSSQAWSAVLVSGTTNQYQFKNVGASNRCMTISGQSTANAALVQLWDCMGQSNEKFAMSTWQ
jgi:hypothetical protein